MEEHSHAAVEVHTVDTNTGVVLDTQVNVLADTETEVTGLGEVLLSQLVLLDLEATLEDLLSLGTTDGNVDGDLFVTTDTEGTDGVTGLAYSQRTHQGAALFPYRFFFFLRRHPYCRPGSDHSAAQEPWRHE